MDLLSFLFNISKKTTIIINPCFILLYKSFATFYALHEKKYIGLIEFIHCKIEFVNLFNNILFCFCKYTEKSNQCLVDAFYTMGCVLFCQFRVKYASTSDWR